MDTIMRKLESENVNNSVTLCKNNIVMLLHEVIALHVTEILDTLNIDIMYNDYLLSMKKM